METTIKHQLTIPPNDVDDSQPELHGVHSTPKSDWLPGHWLKPKRRLRIPRGITRMDSRVKQEIKSHRFIWGHVDSREFQVVFLAILIKLFYRFRIKVSNSKCTLRCSLSEILIQNRKSFLKVGGKILLKRAISSDLTQNSLESPIEEDPWLACEARSIYHRRW